VVSAAFLAINGVFFAAIAASFSIYSREAQAYGQDVSVMADVVQPFVGTVGLLLVLFAPLFTMRVLAEEQREGSISLLLSSPISSWEIVVGKFLGLLGFWVVLFGVGMAYVPVLLATVSTIAWMPLLAAMGGLLLLAGTASAVGLAASSLSGSQMLAAVFSWAVLLFLWVIGFLEDFNGVVGQIGERLGMLVHFDEFAKGLVTSGDLAYFGLLMLFSLFVAQQRVESHRWR
jgi:ABC-2 type transport system permease protein